MSAFSVPTPAASNFLGAGWGRAAVSRFSKAPEEIRAEVIKALEGKISVEFKDYSQWQREPVLEAEVSCSNKPVRKSVRNLQSARPLTVCGYTVCHPNVVLHLTGSNLIVCDIMDIVSQTSCVSVLTDSLSESNALLIHGSRLTRRYKHSFVSSDKSITSVHSRKGLTGTSRTCSSLCIHPWNKKRPSDHTTTQKSEDDDLAILQILIEAKEKSVLQYETLCKDLEEQNSALKTEIYKTSASSHESSTKLLEKYQEYTCASQAIKRHHVKQHHTARKDLKLTATQLQKELEYLEQELLDLDKQLQYILQDVQVLRTYKDKEYPIKEMQISRLTKRLEELSLQQKIEKSELDRVTAGQGQALRVKHDMKSLEILEGGASKALSSCVSAAIMQMTWYNTLLQQEIEEHKQDNLEVEEAVHLLQQEVKILRQMPESDLRRTVFPGLFSPQRKCHPDEDLILDIPMQKPPAI